MCTQLVNLPLLCNSRATETESVKECGCLDASRFSALLSHRPGNSLPGFFCRRNFRSFSSNQLLLFSDPFQFLLRQLLLLCEGHAKNLHQEGPSALVAAHHNCDSLVVPRLRAIAFGFLCKRELVPKKKIGFIWNYSEWVTKLIFSGLLVRTI